MLFHKWVRWRVQRMTEVISSSGRRPVLVVGEDPKLGRLVTLALKPGNYVVREARSADEALTRVVEDSPSLVMLELAYWQIDGVALCEQLREFSDVPIMFLSAADDDESKVRALRCGDDYLIRPFSLVELRARVDALLRRAHPCLDDSGPVYRDEFLTIDFMRHEVTFRGVPLDLTPTEYRLVRVLARYPGRLFLHEDLLTRVWDESYRNDFHLLRLHVANLRKKIEPDPAHPRYLKTRRGLGYFFQPAPPRDEEASSRLIRRVAQPISALS